MTKKTKPALLLASLATVGALALTACGGGGSDDGAKMSSAANPAMWECGGRVAMRTRSYRSI
ncbi:hypothetical protein AB0I84_27990, partial [Streptomyces spectabilis]